MSSLDTILVSRKRELFHQDLYMVTVPGIEGEMGFLENHEPTVSALADGIIRGEVEAGGERLVAVIQGGYVQVTGKKVIILADNARFVNQISREKLKNDIPKLREKLAKYEAENNYVMRSVYRHKLDWCLLQQDAVDKLGA